MDGLYATLMLFCLKDMLNIRTEKKRHKFVERIEYAEMLACLMEQIKTLLVGWCIWKAGRPIETER
jgi:hypothetical protein